MGLEIAAGKIGQAVAQQAARAWLAKRRKDRDRTASLAELAAEELAKPHQRARLEHLVEGIGHQVTEQLEPVLERCGSLPDNEIEAALTAVLDALREIDLSDDALLADDADPEVLARRIRRQIPAENGPAVRLYDLALDQACRYLVQVVRQLPSFQPRALAEVLSRASAQTAQLDEILARLPRTSLHAPQGTSTDDEFRDEYLRYLAASLDRLELLGLSMKNRPKLALSVAYLSLTVSGTGRGNRDWFGSPDDRAHSGVRIESALRHRTLVRGEAGSGKTTLLDWVAVTAARAGFTGDLSEWNDRVPFPIRLRRYADAPLPAPEQFLDHAAPWLAGLMPQGWAHRCLRSGRALVLVDGVDEVPPGKRHVVRDWLRELCLAFPDARVVVTSRPAAADQEWLGEQGFASVLLEQMGPTDVKVFIERWHEAARGAASLPCPVDALPEAQRKLLSQLDSREHLRALAANPLLCAMLCALNLGRTSELPRNRMELYQAALTMLLDLRDAEREIAGLLTTTEKTVLLRDLAWRLTLGGRSQLPTLKVREHVARKVGSMPNVDADPDAIVTHLLERSGVVREPVPGQVDFVHRTFQEYLAGQEAMQDGQVETLAGHAHQDSWSETIVLACGHGQRAQVSELLTEVLDRADREPTRARRLRLLAAACLETITDIDAGVHDRVDEVIRTRLVPPRSKKETRSLVTIGHRVLRYLPACLDELSEAAAVATVRTAALTATPEALTKLAGYANDPRSEVQRELAEGWLHFDPQRYAEEVLADAPLQRGAIMVKARRLFPHLPVLQHLAAVKVAVSREDTPDTLSFLDDVPSLVQVSLSLRGEVDLSPLGAHPRLSVVALFGAREFTGLDTITGLRELRTANIHQDKALADIEFLRGTRLEHVSLSAVEPGADVSPFDGLPLDYLGLHDWPPYDDLSLLALLPRLTDLALLGSTASSAVLGLERYAPKLVTLRLLGPVAEGLSVARVLPNLRLLVLWGKGMTLDLRPLEGLPLRIRLDRSDRHVGLDRVTVDRWI
ncbi:NACHT domain-containing protein [Lentzea tibetensis]|uniref:NACHT domain-containing protein n=1 Tax=Lentzea tibetensis TaxID=2591470 RepID=A0A563EY34_9PSEU|nr:NACHT domain-containing protein [Lentzea tibetensis]TWP52606.1 NACHT domain-containing protein [Lentzea tibetensis]